MSIATRAILIFAFTYVLISVQKLRHFHHDRPSAALFGAVMMVIAGVLSLNEAYRAINMDTIVLLLGMMILVASNVVRGFHVRGIGPAFWGAVVLALLGMAIRAITKNA